ncbi:hypothetical protein O1611_g4830 [Lasiodiplodia mahajangana]|uniref:Uncharacterized protein n=1 Tax=Lasiodiplodia mahajangana TaxID=1108764 RepID=A0ACC2JNA6_9PEZI|nr:hypothetical protein O1611_g4830 [Lasiodiplodia mahajangana]
MLTPFCKIRPSTKRRRSRSSDANVSPVPSRDSGYGSIDPERRSSGASIASTGRRSSPRSRQREQSQFNSGDRSRPPIALDRAEEAIRRVEERTKMTGRRAR